jgi:hypothetical protein
VGQIYNKPAELAIGDLSGVLPAELLCDDVLGVKFCGVVVQAPTDGDILTALDPGSHELYKGPDLHIKVGYHEIPCGLPAIVALNRFGKVDYELGLLYLWLVPEIVPVFKHLFLPIVLADMAAFG